MNILFTLTLALASLVQSRLVVFRDYPHGFSFVSPPKNKSDSAGDYIYGVPPSLFVIAEKFQQMKTEFQLLYARQATDQGPYHAARAIVYQELAEFEQEGIPQAAQLKLQKPLEKVFHETKCMDETLVCIATGPCHNLTLVLLECLVYTPDLFEQQISDLYKDTENMCSDVTSHYRRGTVIDTQKLLVETKKQKQRLRDIQSVNTTTWSIQLNSRLMQAKLEVLIIHERIQYLELWLSLPSFLPYSAGMQYDAPEPRAQTTFASWGDPQLQAIANALQKCTNGEYPEEFKETIEKIKRKNPEFMLDIQASGIPGVRLPAYIGFSAPKVACLLFMREKTLESV